MSLYNLKCTNNTTLYYAYNFRRADLLNDLFIIHFYSKQFFPGRFMYKTGKRQPKFGPLVEQILVT